MADNVAITAGSGTTVAADEVTDGTLGSCKVQFMKIMDGTLDSTNKMVVDSVGSVQAKLYAAVSTANSTTSNLAGGAVFTGTSEDISAYSTIAVTVYSSHASATDGLSLQQSSDGTNWDMIDTYTIPATTGRPFSVQASARYFRLVYTNGATLTTSLRIQTIYKTGAPKASSQRPSDGRSNENDFEEVSGFLHGFNGTTWDRLRTTASGGLLQTAQPQVTVSTDITRPADTTAYAANDNLSDSTSSPTSGGFTLTGAGRVSGGAGIITDLIVTSSAPSTLQGEVWIFDTSVTNINDNAAFAISDAEVKTLVAIVPFLLEAGTNNSQVHKQNLAIGFTCVGSANLRYLVKVKAAYTPISGEVITVRAKILQTT